MPMTIEFQRHERVIIDHIEWSVERRTSTGHLLVGIGDGFNRAFTTEELTIAFNEGRLVKARPAELPDTPRDDFAGLSDRARRKALQRQDAINALFDQIGPAPHSDDDLKHAIPLACKAAGCDDVSPRQFRRWLALHNVAPNDPFVIAPRYHNRGRRRGLSEPSETILQDAIDNQFMMEIPLGGQDLHDYVNAIVDILNNPEKRKLPENREILEKFGKFVEPGKEIDHASRSTVYRRLDEQDIFAVLKAQIGSRRAHEAYGGVLPGPLETIPLGAVEIDHSRINCQCVDENGAVIGRPWITAAIDRCTRMIVALIVTFEPPSATTVLLLLRMMILGKDPLLARYPDITHPWPCFGLPRVIICDNGVEFHSQDFKDAVKELRIDVDWCPTRCPEKKGRIERWFKTLNSGILHILPGTTFFRLGDKDDRDPAMDATIGLERLTLYIYSFVVDYYHFKKHSELRCAPIKRWDDATSVFNVRLPASRKDVDLACLKRDTRTIRKQGIEFKGLFYQKKPDLQLIRIAQKGGDVEIRSNSLDMGSIYVRGKQDRHFIEIPCTANEAKGMSVWQRDALLKFMNENAGGATAEELREWKYRQIAEARATLARGPKHKNVGKKNRAARIIGQGSQALDVLTSHLEPLGAPSPVPPAPQQPPPQHPEPPALAPALPADRHLRTPEQLAAIAVKAGMRPIRRI